MGPDSAPLALCPLPLVPRRKRNRPVRRRPRLRRQVGNRAPLLERLETGFQFDDVVLELGERGAEIGEFLFGGVHGQSVAGRPARGEASAGFERTIDGGAVTSCWPTMRPKPLVNATASSGIYSAVSGKRQQRAFLARVRGARRSTPRHALRL
jgi:hypothetical protein